LSFISDTTIAATKTQGIEMKEKFKANFKIALPAAIATLLLLIILCMQGNGAKLEYFDFNFWQALPYFIVLIAALMGINVFIVLGCGAILSMITGIATGTLNLSIALSAMGKGTSDMFETMIVTILVASIGALMKEFGGFEYILHLIRNNFKSSKGGELGIGLLVSIMDIATANNTVAIVMAGPLAKDVSQEFGVPPARTASILDIFSCVWQGIIPYGAQLLIAAGLAGIGSITIVPFLFYPGFLLIAVLISIIFRKNVKK
ncbi:MAG: Na+/H+ antiporter NhaC family protein, partial [Bacillota bacterium]|nr:Na+/H+ antiporter NhaC family protein [Bacillota bacterium]